LSAWTEKKRHIIYLGGPCIMTGQRIRGKFKRKDGRDQKRESNFRRRIKGERTPGKLNSKRGRLFLKRSISKDALERAATFVNAKIITQLWAIRTEKTVNNPEGKSWAAKGSKGAPSRQRG